MIRFKFKLAAVGTVFLIAAMLVAPSSGRAGHQNDQGESGQLILLAAVEDDSVNDPLEPMNRMIFEFNEFAFTLLFRPVAEVYNKSLPAGFRSGVSNFLDNLATPVTVANQLLQGDPEAAVVSIARFLVNSTIGIGGIADVAAEAGTDGRQEDFGQTLGAWGVNEGFYLVLPIFGPSNPRDAVGKFLVDPYFDPTGQWLSNTDKTKLDYSLQAVDGIDEFAGVIDDLDQVKKTSVDYYAAIRSLYRQKRKSEINNGEQLELPSIPDLGYNLDPEDFDQPLAGASTARGAAK